MSTSTGLAFDEKAMQSHWNDLQANCVGHSSGTTMQHQDILSLCTYASRSNCEVMKFESPYLSLQLFMLRIVVREDIQQECGCLSDHVPLEEQI